MSFYSFRSFKSFIVILSCFKSFKVILKRQLDWNPETRFSPRSVKKTKKTAKNFNQFSQNFSCICNKFCSTTYLNLQVQLSHLHCLFALKLFSPSTKSEYFFFSPFLNQNNQIKSKFHSTVDRAFIPFTETLIWHFGTKSFSPALKKSR